MKRWSLEPGFSCCELAKLGLPGSEVSSTAEAVGGHSSGLYPSFFSSQKEMLNPKLAIA